MLKTGPALLLGVSIATAACADAPTKPALAGPVGETALTLPPAPARWGLMTLPAGSATSLPAALRTQQTTGIHGKAAGGADIFFPVAGGFRENYSFPVITTDASPSAGSNFSATITQAGGTTPFVVTIEAKLDCVQIYGQPAAANEPAGNDAFLSGPITSVTLNGQPLNAGGVNIFFRVLHVGNVKDKQPGLDLASGLYAIAPQGCRDAHLVPVIPQATVDVQIDGSSQLN